MNEQQMRAKPATAGLAKRAWGDLRRHWLPAIVAAWLVLSGVRMLIYPGVIRGLNFMETEETDPTSAPFILRYILRPYMVDGIIYLLLLPLSYGLSAFFLRVVCRRGPLLSIRWRDVMGNIPRFFGTALLHVLRIVWGLLCGIIPGFVYGYAYVLTPYLLHDSPGLKYGGALRESRRLMKGRKFSVFRWDVRYWSCWLVLCAIESICAILFLRGTSPQVVSAYWSTFSWALVIITFCWNVFREALYVEFYEGCKTADICRKGMTEVSVPVESGAGRDVSLSAADRNVVPDTL